MPGPQIVVEMDANEAKLWSAYQRIIQGETQMEAGMKKVSRATNEAAKEQRDLERSAKRVLDSIATPQEKFNQKLQELGRLFTASKLTAEQFRAAVTKVRTEYDALNRVVDTQSQTLEKAAQANQALVRRCLHRSAGCSAHSVSGRDWQAPSSWSTTSTTLSRSGRRWLPGNR